MLASRDECKMSQLCHKKNNDKPSVRRVLLFFFLVTRQDIEPEVIDTMCSFIHPFVHSSIRSFINFPYLVVQGHRDPEPILETMGISQDGVPSHCSLDTIHG